MARSPRGDKSTPDKSEAGAGRRQPAAIDAQGPAERLRAAGPGKLRRTLKEEASTIIVYSTGTNRLA